MEWLYILLTDLDKSVGIGALKWNDLKREPINDITFYWNEILNMQGNSGPYLQYTYARTQSVLEKAGNFSRDIKTLNYNSDELSIMRALVRYPETVEEAAHAYSPNTVANYLYDLAQKYNGFYNSHRILNPEEGEDVRNFRIALTVAAGQVLKNGLTLLGIETPEKM